MRAMAEPITQDRPVVTVRDPACGMEIDPAGAAARRKLVGDTYYSCSGRRSAQFDRQHDASETTGVMDEARLRRVELPVADHGGRRGAERLTGASPTARVRHVIVNPTELVVE